MTIITQSGLILNYRFIREIGLYDAEDDSKSYFSLISAKNDKGEEISLAAFPTVEEGENAYNKLVIALLNGYPVFSLAQTEPTVQQNQKETSVKPEQPDKPSYKNRFIEKDR